MVTTAATAAGRLVTRTTTDRGMLRAFLEQDRLFAAYAICDLDDREFRRTRWAAALDGDRPVAVALEYAGVTPQPMFVMGSNEGIAAILRDVVRPRAAYVAVRTEALEAIETAYRVDPGGAMIRMWVDADRFVPFPAEVQRLTATDSGDLNRLYQLGFASWLPAAAITEGVYCGIRVRGRLVAAAGTHVVSQDARLAVVGNVLTAAEFRGKGYAKATTAAVTQELLRTCDQVVLNVRADNPPAVNAYRRLGYREHTRFEERLVHRIGSPLAALTAPIRRLFLSPREPDR